MTASEVHPFAKLTPDVLIDAVESQGYLSDGRFLALNSYENRVYQIGIDEAQPLIAKFYRPQRWSAAQILEEHQFCFELAEQELPVVAPLRNAGGESLFSYGDFLFALYPRRGGYAPELDNLDNLFTLGRLLGRFHAVGAIRPFVTRPALDLQGFGIDSCQLIARDFIPQELRAAYTSVSDELLALMARQLREYGDMHGIRVHGDCHSGNILCRDDNPHFVDFDDARTAPAIQDIWMLLSGSRSEQLQQLAEIIEGYSEFYQFEARQLALIEVLRTLRIMHHAAWLARRWNDPAFPRAFPWFNTVRYWGDHILALREQLAALAEPPMHLPQYL